MLARVYVPTRPSVGIVGSRALRAEAKTSKHATPSQETSPTNNYKQPKNNT